MSIEQAVADFQETLEQIAEQAVKDYSNAFDAHVARMKKIDDDYLIASQNIEASTSVIKEDK